MSSKRKVVRGNSHLTVYPWRHPRTGAKRWRFAFDDAGVWRYRTFKTLAAAQSAAGKILDEIPEGLAWSGLDTASRKFLEEVHRATEPADRPAVLSYLRSRDSSAEIGAAVERFLAHKRSEAGETTPHLRQVAGVLHSLSRAFVGARVSSIHQADLAAWVESRGAGLGAKTRNDLRKTLVTFWRWALRQGIAGSDPITVAERLAGVKIAPGERRVLDATELTDVLTAVGADWRAWVVLGAFGGLRPEEIAPAPRKKADKRGLLIEEIDWQFGVIRLPAEVAKTNRPRIIPMNDALRAGLQWAGIEPGMTGRVCVKNPSQAGELGRMGKILFGGRWPQDALRHSYGSYRNAILRSLDQVAEEMGTSVAMLHRHYHNPRAAEQGEAWFAVRPPNTSAECSDFDPMKSTSDPHHSKGESDATLDFATKTA